MSRGGFPAKTVRTPRALAAADFLSYRPNDGVDSLGPGLTGAVKDQAKEAPQPRFPIYWLMEGAWLSYDLFGLVAPGRNDANSSSLPRGPNDWGVILERAYRTKNLAPEVLMTTIGRNCAGWLDDRPVRGFDHRSARKRILPEYPLDQKEMMRRDLWPPFKTLVRKPKETECGDTGNSFCDYTTTALSSEFGRCVGSSIHTILENSGLDTAEKGEQILSQVISVRNPVNSCASLGPRVQGGTQFGWVGLHAFQPIPIHPKTGEPDARYDCNGILRDGHQEHSEGFTTPKHDHIHSTASKVAGFDPEGAGRNESPQLPFVLETGP